MNRESEGNQPIIDAPSEIPGSVEPPQPEAPRNEVLKAITFLAQKQELNQYLPAILAIKTSLREELDAVDRLTKIGESKVSEENYTSALLMLYQALQRLRNWVISCDFIMDYLNRTTALSGGFKHNGKQLGKISQEDTINLAQIINELQIAKNKAMDNIETLGRIIDKLLFVTENKPAPSQS